MADNADVDPAKPRLCQKCKTLTPPNPKHICTHVQTDGIPAIIAYCSKKCKKEDEAVHRIECQNSKYRCQLWQAGRVLQEVVYAMRRKFFDLPVTVKKSGDGKLIIDSAPRGQHEIAWEYSESKHTGLTSAQHRAVLSYRADNVPTEFFATLIQESLEGCADEIEELVIVPHYRLQVIVDRTADAPQEALHEVVLVKLKDGNSYILDLMGSYFDQHRSVVPLAEFIKSNISKIKKREPLAHRHALNQAMDDAGLAGMFTVRYVDDNQSETEQCANAVKDHVGKFITDYFKQAGLVRKHIKTEPRHDIAERWTGDMKIINRLMEEYINDHGGYGGFFESVVQLFPPDMAGLNIDVNAKSSNAKKHDHLCNVCKKPADLFCKHIERNGRNSVTPYCSQRCQKDDWEVHKVECRNSQHRRQLYHAGELLQEIMLCFRRKLFDVPVQVQKSSDGTLMLDWVEFGLNDIVWPYPDFQGLTSDDHTVMLTYDACLMPSSLFIDMVKDTLKGCTEAMEVVNYRIQSHVKMVQDLRIMTAAPDMPASAYDCPSHRIIIVTLKDKNKYVFDLTGAQIGQTRAVLPLEDFVKEYVSFYKLPVGYKLGHDRKALLAKYPQRFSSDWLRGHDDGRVEIVQMDVADTIYRMFKEFNMQGAVLTTPQAFRQQKEAFMGELPGKIDAHIQGLGGYPDLHRLFKAVDSSKFRPYFSH